MWCGLMRKHFLMHSQSTCLPWGSVLGGSLYQIVLSVEFWVLSLEFWVWVQSDGGLVKHSLCCSLLCDHLGGWPNIPFVAHCVVFIWWAGQIFPLLLTALWSFGGLVKCFLYCSLLCDHLLQVNKVYSSPQIVIFTYPLESAPTASYNQTTYYLQYMTSLYNSARLQGLSNVQLIQLNGINFPIDGWCDGHPSVAAHANIADQLTVYLKAVLPQWANSTYPLVATS